MEKLEFTSNWNNKLDCKCFTTIRLYNPMKHFNGNKFEVFLQNKFKSKVEIIALQLIKLSQLSD